MCRLFGFRSVIESQVHRSLIEADSELLMHLVLTKLQAFGPLREPRTLAQVTEAKRQAWLHVRETVDNRHPGSKTLLTWILTDGDLMLGVHGGKELFVSTHKTRCSDRDTCPSFGDVCEAPSLHGRVNHCVFASEPIRGENVWMELKEGDIVGVGPNMAMLRSRIDAPTARLPIYAETP